MTGTRVKGFNLTDRMLLFQASVLAGLCVKSCCGSVVGGLPAWSDQGFFKRLDLGVRVAVCSLAACWPQLGAKYSNSSALLGGAPVFHKVLGPLPVLLAGSCLRSSIAGC